MINIIVAMTSDRVIGISNDLPWYLPNDLKHFKELTLGNVVIMGRRTYDSIVGRIGKPLPDRTNIIITRDKKFSQPNCIVANSFKDAIDKSTSENIFVIGGEQIYKLALDSADVLYITEVDAKIKGDAFFPEIDSKIFKEVSREFHKKDKDHPYDYSYVVLKRIVK